MSVKSRMSVSRMSFNKNNLKGLGRDSTRRMSDLLSPGIGRNILFGMGSGTSSNWRNSKPKTSKKKTLTRKLSQSPTGRSEGPLFKEKMTNAEAHRKKDLKKNNFLRQSINNAGQERVHSRRSSSSRGFTDIRKKLKRGTSDKRKSANEHDFAYQTRKMKDEFRSTSRKKLPKRKFSKANALVRLDGESPYMEYLPDRYREYKPKEKKYVRQKSNVSLGSLVQRFGDVYSETRSAAGSRSGSRVSKRIIRKGSNKSLSRMSSFRSQRSVSSNGRSVRSGPSRLKRRKKKSESNDDSFLKMADLVKQRVLRNKNE